MVCKKNVFKYFDYYSISLCYELKSDYFKVLTFQIQHVFKIYHLPYCVLTANQKICTRKKVAKKKDDFLFSYEKFINQLARY